LVSQGRVKVVVQAPELREYATDELRRGVDMAVLSGVSTARSL
jgi:hypothetical protein